MKAILSASWAYCGFQEAVGASRALSRFVREHVRPLPGQRILDIGCGPGSLFPHLRMATYTGFDLSAAYIATAKSRYGMEASFFQADIGDVSTEQLGAFDLVVAFGVLHHLNDALAASLFKIASQVLVSGGRCITCDGVFTDPQSSVARWLLRKDRGAFVRDETAYRQLATDCFGPGVYTQCRTDLLRIPYSHLVMECRRHDPLR